MFLHGWDRAVISRRANPLSSIVLKQDVIAFSPGSRLGRQLRDSIVVTPVAVYVV
jgi:hypothetical protein